MKLLLTHHEKVLRRRQRYLDKKSPAALRCRATAKWVGKTIYFTRL